VVTLAAALETIPDIQQQTFTCEGAYTIEPDSITCERVHGQQDLKSAFTNSCNCVFAQIAMQVGAENMERYAKQFAITESISFDGITTAAGNYEAGSAPIQIGWSGVGQYNDQINPCAYMAFLGAVANGGKGVKPYLVEKITLGNETTYSAQIAERDRIMRAETAQILQEYLRNNVQFRYGDYNFPGMTVCAKTGTAEVGGDKKPNAMFTGFVTDEEYPLAFIICVEDAGYGGTVCIPIASKVLAACKKTLGS
jgi:peptidoglycan glycosyltransferase